MRYRLLDTSGLRVSEAALGTMTFGDDWGWGTGTTFMRRSCLVHSRTAVCETRYWHRRS
jgi:aryl-alcohol dehydrogenase-like predicted oxidoreductase